LLWHEYTRPDIAASRYSILMAVTNVGQGSGGHWRRNLRRAGFPTAFLIFGGLMLLCCRSSRDFSEEKISHCINRFSVPSLPVFIIGRNNYSFIRFKEAIWNSGIY
jgi:hypothetical protein